MTGLMGFLTRVASWFSDSADLKARFVEESPDEIERGFVYLVGAREAPWCAVMVCPCGCGAQIDLSLIKRDRPHWRAKVHWNTTVSLHPSIWRVRGCKSHFFVRRGRINWA